MGARRCLYQHRGPAFNEAGKSAYSQTETFMNVTEIVGKQYTEWAYPKPIDDMVAAIARGIREPDTPSLIMPVLWPERRSISGLKVLVAGCGTNQAAYYALMMPQAEVTGIDLSLTSLNHEKYLVEKHQIKNLTLHHLSLLDVEKLSQSYDFIVCCGVLHHLADPDAGLRALRNSLHPNGIMSIMVYARYLRQGIYMLQDAFRIMGLQQTTEDIAIIRKALKCLPDMHWANVYVKNAPDLGYDAGIVDTFLHPQDRAYTVGEVLEFARSNGLEFWGWIEPAMYSDSQAFPPDHPLRRKIARLAQEDKWRVVELLTQRFGFHQFFLCHPGRKTSQITFEQPGWEKFVPVFKPALRIVEKSDSMSDHWIKLKRGRYNFRLRKAAAALIEVVNGERPISEVITLAGERMPGIPPEVPRAFFSSMHELGHLMYWRAKCP
jgi:2-polyprenyl-3-methyl-5-hydroxy-6-metoxy-1,4-benzoquinol methylase